MVDVIFLGIHKRSAHCEADTYPLMYIELCFIGKIGKFMVVCVCLYSYVVLLVQPVRCIGSSSLRVNHKQGAQLGLVPLLLSSHLSSSCSVLLLVLAR